MTWPPVLSFRKHVVLVEQFRNQILLKHALGEVTLKDITPVLLGAFRILASGGATLDELADSVLESEDSFDLARLYYYIEQLSQRLLIRYSLVVDNRPVIAIEPIAACFEFSPPKVDVDMPFRLSRFAFCRREQNEFVIETPLSLARTILHGHVGAAVVAELAQPRSCRDLCTAIHGLSQDIAEGLSSYLAASGVIAQIGNDAMLAEENTTTLMQWEFHDLLFHSRSRRGRHDYPVGADFRFLGKLEPLPALKPAMSGEVIPLYKPDIERLKQDDPSLTQVLEDRKSIRSYGKQPITAKQLGEFLYRVARVRRVFGPESGRALFYEQSARPYPSGGAAYDLEIYLTINTCQHITSGIYHYSPLDHQLCRLNARQEDVEALLNGAWLSAAGMVVPEVLITITSRFQRLSWKYSGIAYSTTLKNVGVLYQTMYLVATAMDLAPCALGSGNSALAAEAMGLDYLAESAVGEFILGSGPSGDD